MATTDVLVEVDGPKNENLHFQPLGEKLRGRFDPLRLPDPGTLRQRFPHGIPGQMIGLNAKSRTGYIFEPLHDEENAPIREQVEKTSKVPPAVREVPHIDVATWAAWLQWSVEAGVARIASGKLPKPDGKVRTRFVGTTRPDPLDRLTAALEEQSALLRQVLKRQASD